MNQIVQPLPGYKEVKPFVYAGFFPVSNEDYNDLKDSNWKLSLGDIDWPRSYRASILGYKK